MTLLLSVAADVRADSATLEAEVRQRSKAVEEKVIAWRRDIHQHPELGDQETRTAALVAKHLRGLGLEVRTGVARTGVVGILKGGKPGRTVALRADMDALPVKEPEGLPFASKAKQPYLGQEVDLMHACGHDAHTAMLMGVAEVLAGMKDQLPGTVLFLFQPAEEGPSLFTPAPGKTWGAKLMLEEGAFKDPKPDAVFGLHVMSVPLGLGRSRGRRFRGLPQHVWPLDGRLPPAVMELRRLRSRLKTTREPVPGSPSRVPRFPRRSTT